MSNFSAILWREQVTLNEMIIMSSSRVDMSLHLDILSWLFVLSP